MLKSLKVCIGILLSVILFIRLYPPLGARATKQRIKRFRSEDNFQNRQFINEIPANQLMSLKHTGSILRDYMKSNPNRRPAAPIPIEAEVHSNKIGNRVIWYGHSACMLELDGKRILVDPMFGKAPTPFPISNKRYSGDLPVDLDNLPQIDAVVLSHDHYDHLDYFSIKKVKDRVDTFIVPLGVGDHLVRWGISKEKIKEYNWWNEVEYDGLRLVCTPARHFSGRSLHDSNSTLWCSWVFLGKKDKVFFSGDSGYGTHFKEIGEKYGPFDLALMECGQYDERWSTIHMLPEETVLAAIDVKGNVMLPIHWAGFTLSLHDWTDPIERVTKAAQERSVKVATPKIGEPVHIGDTSVPQQKWWK